MRELMTRLTRLPIFWPLLMFGTSGLAVTIANIIWARHLPTATYAVVSLCLAIWNSALRLAPFGADLEVNRSSGVVTGSSIRHVMGTSVITGVISGILTNVVYGLATAVSIAIAIGIAAGGVVSYTSAAMRARRDYLPSLVLLHAGNYATLLVAIATVVTATMDVRSIMGAFSFCIAVVLVVTGPTLGRLRSTSSGGGSAVSVGTLWPLLLITASHELMLTSDRLVTPVLLSFEDLAELSVLLALVGPPFRLLEMSVSYTLLPELASAEDRPAAVKAIRHAAWIAAAFCAAASAAMLLLLGPLNHLLFGEKFAAPTSLVVAVLIGGMIRVAHSFANAAATALVAEDRLPRVAALGTLGAALVVAGSMFGARWGLQGVIYGSLLGWIFRTAMYAGMVRRALRTDSRGVTHLPAAD